MQLNLPPNSLKKCQFFISS